jgi:ATP-binding protein involved in chromosome partitioning
MKELLDQIKKIIEINHCDIKIDKDCIFIHISLNISIKISNEINSQLKLVIDNYFQNIKEYKNYKIKIIFSRSKEKINEKNEKKIKERKEIPNIKNILIVASGKGGVGKSTIAANLSVSLARIGWRVGLLDADIYGASIPTIFEIDDKKIELNNKSEIIPIEKYNVKINSIDFVTDDCEALIWRGPMISKVLNQLLNNTEWGDLDYLIIDTPPGTGDIHLTLLENYKINSYLLVSTSHITSLKNTKKTQEMFEKFNIKKCNLILNMENLNNDQKVKLFNKNENFNLINYNQIFHLPFFLNNSRSIFCLDIQNEKIFEEIARNTIKLLQYS